MHLVDYGTLKIGFYQVLRIGFDSHHWKYIVRRRAPEEQAVFQKVVSDAFDVFRKCLPSDYARKPRDPFVDGHHYKSIECRLVGLRLMPALLNLPSVQELMKEYEDLYRNYINVVVYCRLVCHFSAKALPDVSFSTRFFFYSLFFSTSIRATFSTCSNIDADYRS